MGMLLWLAALMVLSALLLLAFRREFARLERERRSREALAQMAEALNAFKVALGMQLLPTVQAMGQAFIRATAAMEPLREALNAHASDDAKP